MSGGVPLARLHRLAVSPMGRPRMLAEVPSCDAIQARGAVAGAERSVSHE
jgi:hypothetical protein